MALEILLKRIQEEMKSFNQEMIQEMKSFNQEIKNNQLLEKKLVEKN
jgi:hypothetical protein